jgi:hypothetical protein
MKPHRHSQLQEETKKYGLSVAKLLWNSGDESELNLEGLVKKVKDAKELEGCVLKFENEGKKSLVVFLLLTKVTQKENGTKSNQIGILIKANLTEHYPIQKGQCIK